MERPWYHDLHLMIHTIHVVTHTRGHHLQMLQVVSVFCAEARQNPVLTNHIWPS